MERIGENVRGIHFNNLGNEFKQIEI